MKVFYYLKTCNTCKRIMNDLSISSEIKLIDIKSYPINLKQLEEIRIISGSYESLFNKRAQLYKQRNLKNKSLTESEYRDLILEHYTFLKRPVLIFEKQLFIGNSIDNIKRLKVFLDEK
ncbi:MAG: arsenate reductase [Flavobacteriaceae bacterium]|jgi:arsenate reductase